MSREAEAAVVVAGGLVSPHRDTAPLLELVEPPLVDVAAAVPGPLLLAGVVPWFATLAAASDLIANPAALLRLAGHVLIEQHDEWGGTDCRYFSEHSMKLLFAESEEVAIPEPNAA